MMRTESEGDRADPMPLAFALSLTAVCAAYAFATLTAESFWTDELFTRYFIDVSLPISDIWQRMINEPHPPTYYLALRAWADLFGDSSFALRALSLTAYYAMLVIPFTPFGRAVLGARRNLFVTLLATSFILIKFAQEARAYEFLALLALLTTLLNAALLCRIREGKPVGIALGAGAAVVYPVTALLHVYGLLFSGLSLLYICGLGLLRRHWATVALMVSLGAMTLLLEAWWLYLSFSKVAAVTGGGHWISFDMIPREVASFAVKAFSGNVFLAALLVLALLRHGGHLISSSTDRMMATLVLLGFALPILASLHSPMVIDRVLIVFVPAIFFVAAGLLREVLVDWAEQRRTWVWPVLALGLALAVLMGKISTKPDWEGTAKLVASFRSCATASVVAYPVHAAAGYPMVDTRQELFLHRYAYDPLEVQLIPLKRGMTAPDKSHPCPVFGWLTRVTPAAAARLLAGANLDLADFDQFWLHEAVVLFKRRP